MSDFTCQCTDTMVATCTSSFASAYLCAAVVAIAVVLARVCTCDLSDYSDSSDDETNDAVKSMFSWSFGEKMVWSKHHAHSMKVCRHLTRVATASIVTWRTYYRP